MIGLVALIIFAIRQTKMAIFSDDESKSIQNAFFVVSSRSLICCPCLLFYQCEWRY